MSQTSIEENTTKGEITKKLGMYETSQGMMRFTREKL
jgi:hypothetical protein